MTHPHTSLKFQVLITADGFSQARDPWQVKIQDTFGRVLATVNRDDTFRDTAGGFYFLLADVPTGRYHATTAVHIPDEDYDDQYMVITDRQHLVDVGLHDSGCRQQPGRCPCTTEGVSVTFTRVLTKSIDGADYLADINGNYILTADGKRIQFTNQYDDNEDMAKVKLNMTGDEFKRLIEGTDPNGVINTLHEAMAAMQGISDDTTIKQEVEQQAAEQATGTYDEADETLYLDGETPDDPDEGTAATPGK